MIHNYLRNDQSSDHWGVSQSSRGVLAQIQEGPMQARIEMTPEQAEDFAAELVRYAKACREKAQA